MKPYFSKPADDRKIISIRKDNLPHFYKRWHFHEELELVYILESTGVRIIGDHVGRFCSGDLVLLGTRLPHIWLNDPEYFQGRSDLRARVIVLHLHQKLLQGLEPMFTELFSLQQLFQNSSRGIRFSGDQDKVLQLLEGLLLAKDLRKITLCLNLFEILLHSKNKELLAAEGLYNSNTEKAESRLNQVLEYIAHHFHEKITLSNLANLVHMTPPAFCQYFKKRVHKTPFQYIADIRISYARKLLLETDLGISEIAYRCGFNSSPFFSKQFKRSTGQSPLHYRNSVGLLANQ